MLATRVGTVPNACCMLCLSKQKAATTAMAGGGAEAEEEEEAEARPIERPTYVHTCTLQLTVSVTQAVTQEGGK